MNSTDTQFVTCTNPEHVRLYRARCMRIRINGNDVRGLGFQVTWANAKAGLVLGLRDFRVNRRKGQVVLRLLRGDVRIEVAPCQSM